MFHLVFESHDGRALGAESEEKREPVSDIDTEVVDSLKVLDPDGRFREEKRPNRCVATKRRDGRVEDGRGNLGHAATLRFPSSLIEPDVPISGIRLSDWFHREAHGATARGKCSRRSRPSSL